MNKDNSRSIYSSIVFFPYHISIILIFIILILFITGLLYIGILGIAFKKLGLPISVVIILIIMAFLFSSVNIPIYRVKAKKRILSEEYVSFFGIIYKVPIIKEVEDYTIVAVNVGGALIPTLFSIYLMMRTLYMLPQYIISILIVMAVTYLVAKPVKGVGIATPALIPPLTAAFVSLLIAPGMSSFIAYVSGTLGTLLGADILNLGRIGDLGASMISIGGAGTFDGVFLSGIIAVLLA